MPLGAKSQLLPSVVIQSIQKTGVKPREYVPLIAHNVYYVKYRICPLDHEQTLLDQRLFQGS
jgi:hypothetical protein